MAGLALEVGCRIEVVEAFQTDDAADRALDVSDGAFGTIVLEEDGWLLVDFDHDDAVNHWVEPSNHDKLRCRTAATDSQKDCSLACERARHCQFFSGADGAGSALEFPCSLCLVLDIDGTLISELVPEGCKDLRPYFRPHLHDFLDDAFRSFPVGLWTAAGSCHLQNFLTAIDAEGERPWAFTWSRRLSYARGTSYEGMYPTRHHVKKLKKVWGKRQLRALGYSRHSTLIVDNTPTVCSYNYGNAIYVETYEDGYDDVLQSLSAYLHKLAAEIRGGASVRRIEKRVWYQEVTVSR